MFLDEDFHLHGAASPIHANVGIAFYFPSGNVTNQADWSVHHGIRMYLNQTTNIASCSVCIRKAAV